MTPKNIAITLIIIESILLLSDMSFKTPLESFFLSSTNNIKNAMSANSITTPKKTCGINENVNSLIHDAENGVSVKVNRKRLFAHRIDPFVDSEI